MNQLSQVFSYERWVVVNDRSQLRKGMYQRVKRSHKGYVYAVQYGEHVKIGYTTSPLSRIKQICSNAKNYSNIEIGKIAISPGHTNYVENEKMLHQVFRSKRVRGELFDVDIENVIKAASTLEYKDESEKIERRVESGFATLKNLFFNMPKN